MPATLFSVEKASTGTPRSRAIGRHRRNRRSEQRPDDHFRALGQELAGGRRRHRRGHCLRRRSSAGCCGCRNRTAPARPLSASTAARRGCRRAAGEGQDHPHPHRRLARARCWAGADSWAGHGPAGCRPRAPRAAAGGGGRAAGRWGGQARRPAIARHRGNGTKAGQETGQRTHTAGHGKIGF